MTRLTRNVSREVTGIDGNPLIVTLTADGVLLREKRRRRAYLMPYGYAYLRAAQMEIDRERRAKDAQRGGRKSRARVKRGLL